MKTFFSRGVNMIKINEEKNKIIFEFVELFFEDYVKEFDIKFDGLQLSEGEFNELIGKYDSSNGAINNDVYTDEYVYDTEDVNMKKLIIDYTKTDDGKYEILSISGFNDKKN
jgi:uncharacterized protein YdcH (DUF465 family)